MRIVGTEVDFSASVDVRGGKNSAGNASAANGRFQAGAHVADAFSAGEVNGSVAIVPAPMEANPHFAGLPQTAMMANLQGGAAIAGIVPGLSARGMLEGLDVPAEAVGAIVFTAIEFPPLRYNTSNATALMYLNLSGAGIRSPKLGAGASGFVSALKQFGWSRDTRFGGSGASALSDLPADSVYVTLTSGPLDELNLMSASGIVSDGRGGSVTVSLSDHHIGLNEVAFLVVPQMPCPADITGDRVVDDSDFVYFALMYDYFDCALLGFTTDCPGDLNGDGFVDDADFVLFSAAYDALVCP